MNDITEKDERFIVSKIGLVNFWLYDEEEFEFYGGRLILRGSNGSGKSVTMQSFIPLILDGNKSPERLDPFGGKDRKIEDYLIGEADSVQKDESTGYLYMELFKKETNQYLTIGIGLRARKGKGTDFWGFALKNNKRIGKDFYLYKDKNNKVPLTKLELKGRLGIENEFVESAKEYKAMVNRLLFGFDNLDTYDEFIKLLLQLRSNKLSKEFKPTSLNKILNTVLQPLSEDDLRPLSEAIEEMDKTKEKLGNLEKDLKSLNELLKIYNTYNEAILFHKSDNYLSAFNEDKKMTKLMNELSNSLTKMKEEVESKNTLINNLDNEYEINKDKKRQLDDSNITSKVEELNELEVKVNSNRNKISNIQKIVEEVNDKLLDNQTSFSQNNNLLSKLEKEIKELVSDIDSFVPSTYFSEVSLFTENLLENMNGVISFVPICHTLKSHIDTVKLVKDKLSEKELVIKELNSRVTNYEELKESYNKLENNLNNIETKIKEVVLAWEEEFIKVEANNEILKLDDELKKQIFSLMNNYDKKNYANSKEIYNNAYNKYLSKLKEDFYHLQSKLETQESKINDLEGQIINLKRKEDLEISYDSDEEELNHYLVDNNIPFMPFYKLVEFKENVSLEMKNYLEAILLDTKIIGAKIVNESDKSKVVNTGKKGMFLFPSTKKKNNISAYLEPVNSDLFESSYIKKILESISLDQDDIFYLKSDGTYQVDFIYGMTTSQYVSKYIGLLSRLAEKKKQIDLLEKELDDNIKIKDSIESLLEKNVNKQKILYSESLKFPDNLSIEEVLTEKESILKDLDWTNKKEKEIEKEINKINENINILDEKINELSHNLNIPLNILKYEEVLSSLNKIDSFLNNLDKTHNNYINKIDIKNNLTNVIEEIEFNLNSLKEDETEINNILFKDEKKIETIKELLNKDEYKNILDTLLEIEKRLNEIPNEKQDLIVSKTKLESDITYLESDLLEKNKLKDEIKCKLDAYEYVFKKEYELKYLEVDFKDTYECAYKINDKLSSSKNLSIANIEQNFYQAFYHYRLDLNDYNLMENSIFTVTDDVLKLFDENDFVKIILSEAERRNITAIFDGRRMNIFELSNKIEKAIIDNKDLISEQDRHLFEDILLNTVGSKIRDRINASLVWVSKINSIMKEMGELSSLGLRLRWNSKVALTEEELDTKKIVEILKMDPTMIKEADASLLTNHFRSKIKQTLLVNEGNYISYYNIIGEVLDYRNWFEFQMLYQKNNEERRELTDRAYSKFSGGERAKATYIPLFASIFAKYYGAKKDALRIIALDEAFAGVDEVNIREMFGILTSLNLDFIINSQTLWGDYDTIPLMAICELIKPVGSKAVSVERYRWNGKNKEIVINEVENELCDIF